MRQGKTNNGRIAITLTPKGIDTVAFLSADKKESLEFYRTIVHELEDFERRIQSLTRLDAEMELLT